uniref:Molybdopterin biosynthesis protein n=1 Tax=Synarthrophyton chejuense TaxID=2485825 RepID=A0A3G3MFU4_9FLOR|nr:molybdopterin biosynthesis protein [Synarthrophyton chejuense]AYR05690.1 molybdopterin biosynthesis protein [Synarthrophyton chejuense]
MLNPKIKLKEIKYREYERYSRHIILENINKEGQIRIKLAKILFVGAGGINSSSLLYLTACGIGLIGIIDNDEIEISNLQRQIIYNINDLKINKAKAAKNHLQLINPLIKIKTYNYFFSESNAYNLIAEYDIIIDGTDNFTSRYIISRYCFLLHKVHIYGAVDKFVGEVSVFNYQNGPRYNDLYKESSNQSRENCNSIGILNTITGIIGLIQATEAIKIIAGIGNIINGYFIRYNLLDLSTQKIVIKPIKNSKKIQKNKIDKNNNIFKPNYIQKNELKRLLLHKSYKLIDIREPIEFELQHMNNSVNIPLKQFKRKKTLKNIIKEYNKKFLLFIVTMN